MKETSFSIRLIIALFLLSLTPFFPLTAQDKNKKEAEITHFVEKALEEQDYTINVDFMIPQQGRSRALTSPYFIKIKNDSIISYLPYVGRAYSVPYGGGQGLNFDAPIESYSSKKGKKDKTTISIKVKNTEDNYTYTLTIYNNGSTNVYVQPNNKQSISYRGKMELKDEEN